MTSLPFIRKVDIYFVTARRDFGQTFACETARQDSNGKCELPSARGITRIVDVLKVVKAAGERSRARATSHCTARVDIQSYLKLVSQIENRTTLVVKNCCNNQLYRWRLSNFTSDGEFRQQWCYEAQSIIMARPGPRACCERSSPEERRVKCGC